MKHKVICMDCGKVEHIEVEHGKKVESGWAYYGKICLNSCQTDKFFWKIKDGGTMLNQKDWYKVSNSCYGPKAKRKMAEMWSCPTCLQKLRDEDLSVPNKKSDDENVTK